MFQQANAYVLEISRQGNLLTMSIFKRDEFASTIKHYSQVSLPIPQINNLCQEVISILNKGNKKGSLETDLIQRLKKTGQFFWDHLFTGEIKNKLSTAVIKELVLSVDEELIDIPWELLYDGSEFLCLKFNLGRVVRTKEHLSTVQYRSASSVLKMLILANPTNDLRSAYLEGMHIRNQFDRKRNQIKIDFKSTHIDTLYVKKNLRDYDIVHFAGHCEYDNASPQNSGWILSDGNFTTRDILALSESLSLPSLVFSNACRSAKTTTNLMDADYQEKTYSLAAAFLFSGVRHYVGTIWQVEDPVSLVFAREFYSHLINGRSIGESIRLSRLKLIKEYGVAALSWAGYILYGDPNFVLFRAKVKEPRIKLKRDISRYRKPVALFSLAVAIISICICLYIWLPSINPNAYYLFLKSKSGFLKGRNQEVIVLTKRIINQNPLFLAAYPLLADTYQRMGDAENAVKYYFEYALSSEKKGDKKNLASAYIGIGWVYHLEGEYSKAVDFYHKALDLSQEFKDKLNEADVLGKLAIWYMDKKDYDKALELLTKSSEINRQRQHIYKHRYNLACDYFNLGLLFTNKDDFTTAREFYDKSFNLFNKLKLKHELSDYYFNIGEIYSFQKEYQKALDCYMRGLKIDQVQGHKLNIAGDYNMLGELYLEMDNFTEAENYFNQAILIAKEINAQPELASAYYNLGILYKKCNKKNKAREYLRSAQEIYRTIDESRYQEIKQLFSELD